MAALASEDVTICTAEPERAMPKPRWARALGQLGDSLLYAAKIAFHGLGQVLQGYGAISDEQEGFQKTIGSQGSQVRSMSSED